MWVICFQPIGTNQYVPQIICQTEQEARNWVQRAPFSAVGCYIYMFVPLANPTGYFKREEEYPCFSTERRQWQIEVGDWTGPYPIVN